MNTFQILHGSTCLSIPLFQLISVSRWGLQGLYPIKDLHVYEHLCSHKCACSCVSIKILFSVSRQYDAE